MLSACAWLCATVRASACLCVSDCGCACLCVAVRDWCRQWRCRRHFWACVTSRYSIIHVHVALEVHLGTSTLHCDFVDRTVRNGLRTHVHTYATVCARKESLYCGFATACAAAAAAAEPPKQPDDDEDGRRANIVAGQRRGAEDIVTYLGGILT